MDGFVAAAIAGPFDAVLACRLRLVAFDVTLSVFTRLVSLILFASDRGIT